MSPVHSNDSGNVTPENQMQDQNMSEENNSNTPDNNKMLFEEIYKHIVQVSDMVNEHSADIVKVKESLNNRIKRERLLTDQDKKIVEHIEKMRTDHNDHENQTKADECIISVISSKVTSLEKKVENMENDKPATIIQKADDSKSENQPINLESIKNQIKDELKEEIKDELKQELKTELLSFLQKDSKTKEASEKNKLVQIIDDRLECLLSCDPSKNPKGCVEIECYKVHGKEGKPDPNNPMETVDQICQKSEKKKFPKILEGAISPRLESLKNKSAYNTFLCINPVIGQADEDRKKIDGNKSNCTKLITDLGAMHNQVLQSDKRIKAINKILKQSQMDQSSQPNYNNSYPMITGPPNNKISRISNEPSQTFSITDSDTSNVSSPARAIHPSHRSIGNGVGSPNQMGFFGQSQQPPQFSLQKVGQQNMGQQNMGQQRMMMNNGNNPQAYASPVGQQIEVTSTTTTNTKKVYNSNQ